MLQYHVVFNSKCSIFTQIQIIFDILETKLTCKTFSLEGVCVSYSVCEYTQDRGDFITPDFIAEIKARSLACNQHGTNLICCKEVSSELLTKFMDVQTTRDIVKPKVSQRAPSTTSLLQNHNKASTIDPVLHPNFKFFKSLKCGYFSGNRVANGRVNSERFKTGFDCLKTIETRFKKY